MTTKGIISSVVVLFAFLGTLLVVTIFVSNVQESRDLINSNAVGDRVFYKFVAIDYSVQRIIERGLSYSNTSFRISEGVGGNAVFINITLPSAGGNFSRDMANFERFAETYLNQTNMVVDLNLTEMASCLPLTVWPYNITIKTYNQSTSACGFGSGQRNLTIVPGTPGNYITSLDINVRTNRTRINPASASWSPASDCTGGTLNWTIRVTGNTSGSVYGPVTNMVKPDGRCVFTISENVTGSLVLRISNRQLGTEPNSTLTVNVLPNFNNITFASTIYLADVPGKLRIGLSPQSLKVRETLFRIERNDTVVIQ